MAKNLIKLSVMFVFLFITGLVVMFGSNQEYNEKCYDNFNFDEKINSKVIFLTNNTDPKIENKNDCKNYKNKWHLKVYFDNNDKWVKFENYDQKNQLLRTFHNTLSLSNNPTNNK